jgi:uncharacterized protein (UPF0264 family)
MQPLPAGPASPNHEGRSKPGLLVSVRSAAEAEVALAGGADLVDVKEPRRGPLGPADPETWAAIQATVAGRRPTSVALGELLSDDTPALARQCAGYQFAKIGLAGCHERAGWVALWHRAVQSLPPGTDVVPVAYADWRAAKAPSPRVAAALAQWSPARLVLIDTFDKSRGNLLDHLALEYLQELTAEVRETGVELALAGSLTGVAIALLRELAPRYFGVRGAACRGGRDGPIELACVKSLSRLLHGKVRIRPR